MAAEEEDEDIWDSWEDMADSGELERRMEEREKQIREKDQKASNTTIKIQETKTGSSILMQEDTNRTLYKPQLRILKRPDSGGSNHLKGQESSKEKPAHKTLAERQAQYAEARARILGSASDENNESEKDVRPQVLQVEQKLPDNVIRLPRGPAENGSKGFELAR